MDQSTLYRRAGSVATIFSTLATVVLVLGVLAMIAGFIQAIAAADEVLVGIFAGLLVVLAIGVYVAVSWAAITMAALVAGYIQTRTGGS